MKVFYPMQHAYKKKILVVKNNGKEEAEFERNLDRNTIDCFL